jgi:hypothetical protein
MQTHFYLVRYPALQSHHLPNDEEKKLVVSYPALQSYHLPKDVAKKLLVHNLPSQ